MRCLCLCGLFGPYACQSSLSSSGPRPAHQLAGCYTSEYHQFKGFWTEVHAVPLHVVRPMTWSQGGDPNPVASYNFPGQKFAQILLAHTRCCGFA